MKKKRKFHKMADDMQIRLRTAAEYHIGYYCKSAKRKLFLRQVKIQNIKLISSSDQFLKSGQLWVWKLW